MNDKLRIPTSHIHKKKKWILWMRGEAQGLESMSGVRARVKVRVGVRVRIRGED
jgi:hypothetical protein